MSKVSTGALLMQVLSVDHSIDGAAWKSRKAKRGGLASMIGVALAIGGPLILKLIQYLRGEQEAKGDVPPELKAGPLPVLNKPAEAAETNKDLVNSGKKLNKTDIVKAIQVAATKHGQDFKTLYSIAGAESSFRTGAKAGSSSATGLFQFTEGTWKYMLEKYPELGYTLNDRNDPAKASNMAALYIKSLRKSLQGVLGKEPSIRQIYLAYFLGPSGAARFFGLLKSKPKAIAASLFPSQAKSNPNLFYEDGDAKKPLTLSQVFDRIGGKVEKFYAQAAKELPTPGQTVTVQNMTPDQVRPVKADLPTASAQSVPQTITAAVLPTPAQVAQNVQSSSSDTKVAVAPQQERKRDISYIRDRHNRVISIG